jgi:hypothetical protein
MSKLLAVAALAFFTVTSAGAQVPRAPDPQPAPPSAACPPDVQGTPPTVGGPPTRDLSDRLSDSKGVICPPAGVDPGMTVPPPDGGAIRVIPAPGSPGGDPTVQPK